MGAAYTDSAGRRRPLLRLPTWVRNAYRLTLVPASTNGERHYHTDGSHSQRQRNRFWIFKVAGALNLAAAKNVILIGGALPKNVFWQLPAVAVGANSTSRELSGSDIDHVRECSSVNGGAAQTAVI